MEAFFRSLENAPYLGQILSIGSAFLWAVAVILFRVSGRTVHPIGLNFFKSTLATVLLVLTVIILGHPLLPPLPLKDYRTMALSGLAGIALSDTLFFYCLNLLGASLTAIVDCLYSPFVIFLSFLFLGERIQPHQGAGVFLILVAVVLIATKRSDAMPARRALLTGVTLGALAMLTQAAGIVLMKPLLSRTPLLWATLWRIGVSSLVLLIFLLFHPIGRRLLRPLASFSNWPAMFPASFLGAYVGLITWMGGMKHTLASVAAPLNQLHTIFIFVLGALFLKEKVTRAKLMALLLAVAGALLVWIQS